MAKPGRRFVHGHNLVIRPKKKKVATRLSPLMNQALKALKADREKIDNLIKAVEAFYS
jgi:hypothetical protein